MEMSKLKEQVEIIRQAFGYINQFQNRTFVIKLDGSLINNSFFPILIKDIVLLHQMGIRIILVPGAKSRIDEILQTYHLQSEFINGVRISPPEAIPFIKMAAFDVSNRIMTMLAESNTNAVIGNWVKARSIGVRDGIDFQSSGIVEKLQVDILHNVLREGLVPIFPNIGWNGKGKPYNLSSNELAFTIAVELNASKLFFLTDFGGISSQNRKYPEGTYISSDGIISQLTVSQAASFINLNQSSSYDHQMELVSLAYRACTRGVERVHIIDGRTEGMLLKEIFSNRGFGTMIYSNQHENFRPMRTSDIPEVLALMQPLVDRQVLVARTAQDLEDKIDEYVVYEVDGTIHACGALYVYPDRQGEIGAIVVDEMYSNLGIGKKLVTFLIEEAIRKRLKAVFALTTQTSDWFYQLGFERASITELPEQKRASYNTKRNSLILRYVLPKTGGKTGASVE